MPMYYYQWIDIIWLPIVYLCVAKQHRMLSLGFVVCSVILIRLITETMLHIGYGFGIMGFLTWHVHTRGLLISGLFYTIFLCYAHFAKKTEKIIFFGVTLTLFFMIFLFGSLIMLL